MRKNLLFALVLLCSLVLGGCFAPPGGLRAVIATSPSPAQGEYPLTVTFDASGSSGDIVEYLWTFGDGVTGSGLTVTHTYASRGPYTAFLTVVARDGTRADAAVSVLVNSKLPVAQVTFSPTSGIRVGTEVTFDASASHDPDGEIAEYLWDFGDGTATSTTVPIATHRYRQPGQYAVSLVVKDREGDLSNPAVRLVVVSPGSCCGN